MAIETIQALPLGKFDDDQRVRKGLNLELIDQLAQSFQTVGQLQPVRARWVGERLVIVDGHHRLAAARKAEMKTINCIVEVQTLDEGAVLQRQLISNCLREALPPLDTARAVQGLMTATGWNASQAAANLAFSNAKVTRLLALLKLPATIIEQVEAGKIPVSGAYELLHIDDAEQQTELAQQMATGQLTRDGVAGKRKAAKRGGQQGECYPTRVTAILGESRSITVASAGLTLERFITLIEELLAKARRERSRGTELGTFISLLRDQARANK